MKLGTELSSIEAAKVLNIRTFQLRYLLDQGRLGTKRPPVRSGRLCWSLVHLQAAAEALGIPLATVTERFDALLNVRLAALNAPLPGDVQS